MGWREEFPDYPAADMPEILDGFEDSSWANDVCPSFTCDVFVLWIDYAERAKREFPDWARFTMTCEGATYLETDDWADVLAFVNDGRRDFLPYQRRA